MYNSIITIFNYHKQTKTWYPSVIKGTHIIETKASAHTLTGTNNGDTVEIIVHCTPDKVVITSAGEKQYTGPKEYARCADPASVITFAPETDFIFAGVWDTLDPIAEDEDSEGLYHEMNNEHDGVYMVTSAIFYGLLPHFEIGGR